MKKDIQILSIAALFFLLMGSTAPAAQTQEKISAEITGDYILDLGGRTLPFTILLKDAKLYFDAHVPEVDSQPMTPVPGKELTFTSFDPNGDEVTFAFILDDQKKITRCMVSVQAQGAEAEARKVEKK